MTKPDTFKAFAGKELSRFLGENYKRMRLLIEQETEDYIRDVDEEVFIKYLFDESSIEPLAVDLDHISYDTCEKQVSGRDIPPGRYYVDKSKSYPVPTIICCVPFAGNTELIKYSPYEDFEWTPDAWVKGDHLCFEMLNFQSSAEGTKHNLDVLTENVKVMLKKIIDDVNTHNSNLRVQIEKTFGERKQKIQARLHLLASLNVPIMKRSNLPRTYAIPTPHVRKRISLKPAANASGGQPEPTLDDSTYQEILEVMHGVGKVFERLPSTYRGKREEDLRDHFILYLEPRYYDASVTGETFNKRGKTDILIRHNNSNVFVAECKFWGGASKYLETISQLLGYLTWRDSKTAIVIFVRNKELSPILKAVEEVTPTHNNFVAVQSKREDSWFNYLFHIDGDPDRKVKIAVLLFHLPLEDIKPTIGE